MKNNILTIVLCLGSICLGFVLHNYWEYGGRALQTTLASEEFQEHATKLFANCRSMEITRNAQDEAIYRILLEQREQGYEKMDDLLVELIMNRYEEIIGRQQRALIVFSRESDLEETGRSYTEKSVKEGAEFIEAHNKALNRTP